MDEQSPKNGRPRTPDLTWNKILTRLKDGETPQRIHSDPAILLSLATIYMIKNDGRFRPLEATQDASEAGA